jgi:hypothetical protein
MLHYEDKSSWKGFLLVAHKPGTTGGGSHIRGSMVRASEASYEEVDLVLPGNGRLIFLNLTESLDWLSRLKFKMTLSRLEQMYPN